MELAALRATIRAEPIRPFSLRLVDGRAFDIPTPEHLYVPPNSRGTVAVANPNSSSVTFVDARMIVAICADGGGAAG